MARLVSSSALAKICWKKVLTAESPPMLGSCSVVFSFSQERMFLVIPSQFFLLVVAVEEGAEASG